MMMVEKYDVYLVVDENNDVNKQPAAAVVVVVKYKCC